MKAILILVVFAIATVAHAQPIAITNATVYQRGDKKLEKATVVIDGGKITGVGVGLAVPAGATTIDGTGKTVTAGIIESSTQMGLIEVDLEATGNDGKFGTTPSEIHAAYRATDAYDARSVSIPVARAGGVTSVIAGPRGGLVAGQAAWMSLAETPVPAIRTPVAMIAALGRGATAETSRGRTVEKLRELFDDVDAYRKNRGNYERNASRELVAKRLDLEALIPVLDGRELLVIHASSDVDIRAALAIANERKLRIAIAGGAEAWRLAKELAAAKVPVIVDPTDNLPGDLTSLDVRDDGAAILAKAGVTVAISTIGAAQNARTIRHLAGIAVANGLPWAAALDAITGAPAKMFGAADRGVIDRGAAADVVVWTGDPFELATRADTVIIGGVVQPLATHQTRLRDRYRKLP